MNKRWIGGLAMLAAMCLATAGVAQDRKAQLRTVHGFAVDKDEAPLAGGIVYLKNLKTLTVKTSFADSEGRYRFSGLDPNVDYEIHAEYKDMTSKTRTISSLDGSREIVINLKIDKKKD